jgi:hypothetical protein
MVFDKLAQAFDGGNVRILLTDTGLQEIFNCYNMTKKKTTPRTRVDTRGGAGDFYGAQLREVTFETVVTKDLFLYIDTNSDRNARGALPAIAGQVIADSVSGNAADDITETFNVEIPDLEDQSIDGNYYWIRVHMIIKPGTYSVA